MERNSDVITCPLPEALREALGITEDSFLDAYYEDGKIYIRVMDEGEFEDTDLEEDDNREVNDYLEDIYTLGRLEGQLEGYKEGYRDGYQDGHERTRKRCKFCEAISETEAENGEV